MVHISALEIYISVHISTYMVHINTLKVHSVY